MDLNKLDSDFLRYLATNHVNPGDRLPPLADIGQHLGVSVGKLREELAVARGMGFVSVRPRLGVQREPFHFKDALLPAILFSLATGETSFEQLSRLRQSIELTFWDAAVVQLTDADKTELRCLVESAWGKLRGEPIHIPNGEHRQLHLTIFSRLDNPFVQGLLEAYWDAYEAVEMTRFVRYQYWLNVWNYHERIVDALAAGDYELGRRLLNEHFSLLQPAAAAAKQNTTFE